MKKTAAVPGQQRFAGGSGESERGAGSERAEQ